MQGGLSLIRDGFDDFGAANTSYRAEFIGALAGALARDGQVSEGRAGIEEEIDRCERTGENWIIAELLRVKGEFFALNGGPAEADEAEPCFRRALDEAERQNALSWELRAAMSLARLTRDQDRSADAIARLRSIYDRFTEGFETVDLKIARTLLADLKSTKASR